MLTTVAITEQSREVKQKNKIDMTLVWCLSKPSHPWSYDQSRFYFGPFQIRGWISPCPALVYCHATHLIKMFCPDCNCYDKLICVSAVFPCWVLRTVTVTSHFLHMHSDRLDSFHLTLGTHRRVWGVYFPCDPFGFTAATCCIRPRPDTTCWIIKHHAFKRYLSLFFSLSPSFLPPAGCLVKY